MARPPAKAVAHAWAKSVRKDAPRSVCGGLLRKFRPSTELLGRQGTGAPGASPVDRIAADETMVKACPGWYLPDSGSRPGMRPAARLAAARILPVPACTATIAADAGRCPRAWAAASWTPASSMVGTRLPARPGH